MEQLCCHDATECNLLDISQSVETLNGYFNNDDDDKEEATSSETDRESGRRTGKGYRGAGNGT